MASYPAHRIKDLCTGHSCFPPRKILTASKNVFVNNKGQTRQTDMYAVHGCEGSHSGAVANGSPTVYANNLQATRVGDPASCGSFAMTGSSNVFIGDGS